MEPKCESFRLSADYLLKCPQASGIKDVPLSASESSSSAYSALHATPRLSISGSRPFRQFKRLTIQLEDASQLNPIVNLIRMCDLSVQSSSNPMLQQYDLVAVQPTTDKLFHTCCTALEIDIISFDMSRRIDYHFKRPSVTSV